MIRKILTYLWIFVTTVFPFSVHPADLTDWLSFSGSVTGVYQWLSRSRGDVEKRDRGSSVIDFDISLRPSKNDEFLVRASFAKGNGLKKDNQFHLSPNADDLFDDLHNINGHPRDHLQELWYSHKFEIGKETFLRLRGGIIDSSGLIDDNIFAADELQQFMNEALVHNPLANLPSYDAGLAVEFEQDRFHLRLVGMVSKNENEQMDVKNYSWVGAQIGYKLETSLGEGNYRLYGYTTNRRFENWDADAYKSLKGFGISFDQSLIKDRLGAFFRAGWQDDSAKVDYKEMISFGLNLNGSVWGRKDDEIGIGYAYLKSPSRNEELRKSQVFEGYVKFKLLEYKFLSSDITFDYQYIGERLRREGERSGHVYGTRFNINF